MSESIIFNLPKLVEREDAARLVTTLEFDGRSEDMWYEVPSEYASWFSTDRADGFVVGFLLQAMGLHKNIVTRAPMSSRLWHNLTQFFVPMMAKAFPNLHAIEIEPAALVENVTGAEGVAGGFSGGIDSFATVVDHFVNEESPNYRISHFLFHNVGSHGDVDYEAARILFRQRYATIMEFPRLVGLPFVPVDSNIHEIVPTEFVETYITLNASVLLVLQNQFRRYFYASSYKYQDCGVNVIDDVGRFNPLAFQMLSTETLDCVSSGGQMSRVEKTALVADYDLSRRFLNVCIAADSLGHNCSTCLKCCRTLLTLDLLDLTERYSEAFDLGLYRSVRKRYIRRNVLNAPAGGFEYEIVELARKVGKEPWALKLRRRQDRKDLLRKGKDGFFAFCHNAWWAFKQKVKSVAPATSAKLGKAALKVLGR